RDGRLHTYGVGDDIDASDGRVPAGRQYARRQHADGRGFACAIRAEQAENFAAPDAEADAIDGFNGTAWILLLQRVNRDDSFAVDVRGWWCCRLLLRTHRLRFPFHN